MSPYRSRGSSNYRSRVARVVKRRVPPGYGLEANQNKLMSQGDHQSDHNSLYVEL